MSDNNVVDIFTRAPYNETPPSVWSIEPGSQITDVALIPQKYQLTKEHTDRGWKSRREYFLWAAGYYEIAVDAIQMMAYNYGATEDFKGLVDWMNNRKHITEFSR